MTSCARIISAPASTSRGTCGAEQAEHARNAVDAGAPGTVVGVEVFDRHSQSVVTRIAADRQFHSASVVKLLIAARLPGPTRLLGHTPREPWPY